MKIILTHEQTDFDGLASLLGAHLLDETAVPVLPRRMNRNVRAFLTIYGVDLPFVDPRDLRGQEIEAVTLVDTQSLISIKGMDEKTTVRIVDHHLQSAQAMHGKTDSVLQTQQGQANLVKQRGRQSCRDRFITWNTIES